MAIAPEQSHQMQTAINCDTCENTAKHLCKNCHDRLCDRCKDIHSKSKGTFDHEVVLLTFESLTLPPECPSHVICMLHPKFRASIGCQKCEVPVCEKCLIGEHNGHNLIEFSQLFEVKKEKMEQKLSTVVSELPKYESMLAKVEGMKRTVVKNKDVVKKEINSHFELTISFLTSCKEKLLKSVDVKTSDDLNLLNHQVNDLQTYIHNMVEYKANFQNEDLQERLLFILYGVCSTDDIIPDKCPPFINPGILKYLEGCLENPLMHKISGDVCKRFKNTNLLREGQLVKNIDLLQEKIESLSFDSGLFWVFSSNKTAFCKYDQEGNCVDTIQVNIHRFKNHPFCVVDNDGVRAIFRSETHKALMITDSCKKIFIDVSPFAVTCMCLTRDCEILAGLANSTENYFGIAIYSLEGVRKQFITQVMKKWSREPLLSGNSFRPYIVENVNGDICLSVETNLSKVVNVIRPNGDHRFTYGGKGPSFLLKPFLPRGICTNVLGHILIADENNHGIHILDKDGGFLTLLNIPGEPRVIPISLCIDRQSNLCIGCADGKIRILKYLE